MKKLICLAVVLAIGLVMAIPMLASAATSVNIAITATGSEINGTCNQTAWAVGTVQLSQTKYTSDNLVWGKFTNSGSEHMDVVCHGHDMTGGTGWTLHNTTPGAATFAMMGSITTVGDVEIHTSNFAFLSNITTDNTFGLVFKGPTSAVGNSAMTMTDSGLLFTFSIHV